MKSYFRIIFLLIAMNAGLRGMDAPVALSVLLANPRPCVDYSDDHKAFAALTKNKARLLKSWVAQEQRGEYCPELSPAEIFLSKLITFSYPGVILQEGFSLDKNTLNFVALVAKRTSDARPLVQLVRECDYFVDDEKCINWGREELQKNRYIANAYGSYEPYQDRIIAPLHYVLAAHADNLISNHMGKKFCKLLLSHGANPNARDDVGNTPMHHASTPGLVRLLCDYGAKTDIKGKFDCTPLINHIRLHNWPVVKCLLDYSPVLTSRMIDVILLCTKPLVEKMQK